MRKKIFIGIIVLILGFLAGGITYYILKDKVSIPGARVAPSIPVEIIEKSKAFSDVVSSVSPAVVNISTVKVHKPKTSFSEDDQFFEFFNDFFSPFYDTPKKWKEQELGSGVIVSPDGYIITNNHVVSDASEIRVTLYDKRTLKAKVIGSDPKTDIAVVKISSNNLPTIPWGDSDNLKVGEFVLAIGNPFGLNHTVTMGIISAVGRANVGIAEYEDFIQTDAAINPGNSGGPLVNTDGRLIGINTAIFTKSGGYQGIGFAVPSNMARLLLEELLKEGMVIRGWLGISIQELTPELSQKFGYDGGEGALVGEVIAGSPAEKAGIRRGDIIMEYDSRVVSSSSALKNMVAQTRPGKEVRLKIFRNNKQTMLVVIVGELPKEVGKVQPSITEENVRKNALTGLSVMELTKTIAKQLNLDVNEGGVVVVRVDADSPAEDAGIKRGDVIHEIDKNRIRNLDDWSYTTSKIKPDDNVLLYITRGSRRFYLTITSTS